MAVSYNRLWKLLIDKRISVAELRRMTEISPNTMTKLKKDEAVNLSIIERICNSLDCDFSDVMEYIKEGANREQQ